ncbi:hypothetical protein [Kaistella flava (ex Peng et al. 2021)]|uniref:hypothetical protein n=1 Tax=Kaistella flava (ex Peng et al. 2021) TaxID=2038776 RepID=UPI0018811E29|nr:hypothetical protein [Kaistella flava (ex Peng et al. 2021)]
MKKKSEFFKFPKNTTEFTTKFSLDQPEFEKFLKVNKLSFSKEGDMIKMIEFLNK